MRGYVVAVAEGRRAKWERIIGTAVIPVVDVRPRRAEFRDGPAWAFDVAVGELHEGQLCRLAAYVARVNRVDYVTARRTVESSGVVVRAEGLRIETADAVERRPFRFVGFQWLVGLGARARSLAALRLL